MTDGELWEKKERTEKNLKKRGQICLIQFCWYSASFIELDGMGNVSFWRPLPVISLGSARPSYRSKQGKGHPDPVPASMSWPCLRPAFSKPAVGKTTMCSQAGPRATAPLDAADPHCHPLWVMLAKGHPAWSMMGMVMPNLKTRTCLDDLRTQIVHERQTGIWFVYSESLYISKGKRTNSFFPVRTHNHNLPHVC